MTPRSPRADSARNREALLTAGAEALRRDIDAPLEDIAAAAGLSRRAVYGHFPSREALVDAVIARGAERIAAAVGPLNEEPPLEALARLGARLWDAVVDVHAVARMALTSGRTSTVAYAMNPIRRRLRALLSQAAEGGLVRTDIPVTTLAALVERAAIDVLEVADASEPGCSRRLAMTHPLCAAGVGAVEAARIADLVDQTEAAA
ncbi:MAG: TetR/AcrR family transcriptional regulator [Demequina sp.]|uniref:TetR/AcrR family transcriptional regulator n=1 Tax=Demequina sp. TaxID=2050685 RepID=UPI003A8BE869